MSFDYNERGHEYSLTAIGDDPAYLAMLSEIPRTLFKTLEKKVHEEYQNANTQYKEILIEASGCLDQLRGFLYQLARVAQHTEEIKRIAIQLQDPPIFAFIAPIEACYDFEGLLFIARASLDRIAYFVSQRNISQKGSTRQVQRDNSNYATLSSYLQGLKHKDEKAKQIIGILAQSKDLVGLITHKDGSNDAGGLRNRIAHTASTEEGRDIGFTIHKLNDDQYLIFDCELFGFPLLASAEKLTTDVPFIVLNSIAVYLGVDTLTKGDFSLTWTNPTAAFSDYLDVTNQGRRFTVGRVVPNGFNLNTASLRAEVLKKIVTKSSLTETSSGANDPNVKSSSES